MPRRIPKNLPIRDAIEIIESELELFNTWIIDDQVSFEERAAILEFDGNKPRWQAEIEAYIQCFSC